MLSFSGMLKLFSEKIAHVISSDDMCYCATTKRFSKHELTVARYYSLSFGVHEMGNGPHHTLWSLSVDYSIPITQLQ